jgi:hypothetical protein
VLKINLEVNQEYHIINIITHQTLIHAASAINSNKVAHVTWELKSEAEGRWFDAHEFNSNLEKRIQVKKSQNTDPITLLQMTSTILQASS